MGSSNRTPGWPRVVIALVAILLIASAMALPLWRSALAAPQYPDGLELVVFGDRAEGDLAEIDSLNHYIGMRPFSIEDFPEIALWPLGLAVAGVAVILGLMVRGVIGRLARLYLWLFPLSILAVIQLRLHQFGHDLDPGAAFRMEGFTPWAVGPTRVWNFTAWSLPGTGTLALLATAALISFGPKLADKLLRSTTTALALLVILTMTTALPAVAHDGHDHSGHDHSGQGSLTPSGDATRPTPTHPSPSGGMVDHDELLDLASLIAGVPDGGTLTLPSGSYRGDLVIDRSITIEGDGMPLIVGSRSGTVITVTAPGTTLKGIHVTGSGHGPGGQPAGIRVAADGVEIDGVIVADSYMGIAVGDVEGTRILNSLILGREEAAFGGESHAADGSHDAHLVGGRGDGISLWESDWVLVRGTRIQDVRDGIYASFASSVLIDNVEVANSRYAVHTMYSRQLMLIENRFEGNLSGAVLMYGGEVEVVRNSLSGNVSSSTGFGILLKDVTDATVVENRVTDNRVGLHLDGPAGGALPMMVVANTVADNQFGVVVFPSAAVVFTANSFVDNLVQVSQQGRSVATQIVWSDRGWGNYWSSYRGYGENGRGLVPHSEASSVNRLLIRSPILSSLANSPSMRIIGAMESRWLTLSPVATDDWPLTEPVSPRISEAPQDPTAAAAAGIAGFAVLVTSAGSFFRLSRRPRTGVRT